LTKIVNYYFSLGGRLLEKKVAGKVYGGILIIIGGEGGGSVGKRD
jgi:hypothetical protein